MTMTIVLVTLAILAGASLMLNAYQWAERRQEKKETQRLVTESALLEAEHQKLVATYNNEKLHKEWAIGRIKDQTSLVKGLEHALKAASAEKYREYKQRKEAGNA